MFVFICFLSGIAGAAINATLFNFPILGIEWFAVCLPWWLFGSALSAAISK